MNTRATTAARLAKDQAGQMTVEWTMLLFAIGIPMMWVISVLLDVLREHYRMVTFLECLPFP
ncbi:MAG: hypothetical protein FJ276_21215 [Planctomycetes bacterium]|nr:hypothetical protein [Planctomycetota bacterium]